MECWPLRNHKSFMNKLLWMMIAIFLVQRVQGGCVEEERKALLEIKASFNSYISTADYILPTWAVDGGECCDWERVKCNTTTGHITQLSLDNLNMEDDSYYHYYGVYYYYDTKTWPLNVSLFIHFEELRSLNLSQNHLDNGIVNTGLERLSTLKKLEMLDLSWNRAINNDVLPSVRALTSLRILDLSRTDLGGDFPAKEFAALEKLEMLDLTDCAFNGTFQMQGCEGLSRLNRLERIGLSFNRFNKSIISCLSALPSFKSLNLRRTEELGSSFPFQELSGLRELEELDLSECGLQSFAFNGCEGLSRLNRLERIDLSFNGFNKSIISCLSALPSLKSLNLGGSTELGSSFPFQGCEGLSRLNRLERIDLSYSGFNKSIISCLSALPSLKSLNLEGSTELGSSFTFQELSGLRELEELDLSGCGLRSLAFNEPSHLPYLEVLDLSHNDLNGTLPMNAFCELKNLQVLDLSFNVFEGNLPLCLSGLSSLKRFDIRGNRFRGTIPPSLIANLTSLEYIDLSDNKFGGSLSLSLFSNHSKLEVVQFSGNDEKFEVETEQPLGWIPMFQLRVLQLSDCNINRHTGRVVPGFLLHQHKLHSVDLSHNSLKGQLPLWLIKNNTMLEELRLRNNSFGGSICMPSYWNLKMRWLDMSDDNILGIIPGNALEFFPRLDYLNLSTNALSGAIPSSIGDLSQLSALDLSNNNFSGEVADGLFANCAQLEYLRLSNNSLQGQILSGNLSLGVMQILLLDSNNFTGKIVNETFPLPDIQMLDISNNLFSGVLPGWISNTNNRGYSKTLLVRNNRFEGRFPCGNSTVISFLDISRNSFSGSIPSCLSQQVTMHLHLESNKFTGSIPESFRNLTDLLTLDMGNNKLSGKIPSFLGKLSNLRILILRENMFSAFIPEELCRLSKLSLIDLSSNSLSDSIPTCLQNITGPTDLVFTQPFRPYVYPHVGDVMYEKEDEVAFITKSRLDSYKGGSLDLMSGLDFSCNSLTGVIPEELGLMIHIHALNLSHNQLTGPIPRLFSHLKNIESLDLSSNTLSGRIPPELAQLYFLGTFIVANNNLSGRLPEMKAQFATFNTTSYEGNPFLCGPPLEKKCMRKAHVTIPVAEEGTEKWYKTDMAWLLEGFISGLATYLFGFSALLYASPYWRRRWLDFVEDCMYACYFFFWDCVRKLSMLFYK